MDLDLTDDQELMRETTARFIESACPLTRVRALADEHTGPGADYRRQAAELGWFAMLVPEEFGGGTVSGNGVADAAVVAEERGRFLQPGAFVATNAVAAALASRRQRGATREGAPGDRERRGRGHVGAGVVGRRLVTRYRAARRRRAACGFVLEGASGFVQDAERRRLDPRHRVRRSRPLAVPRARRHAGRHDPRARGARPDPTVLRSAVRRRRTAVVRARRAGRCGIEQPSTASSTSPLALTVAEMVGAMDRDFEVVLDYAKARTAFGRPIGSFQAVKHLLADTSLALEMSKAMAVAAAKAVGGGDRTTPPRSRAWPRRS